MNEQILTFLNNLASNNKIIEQIVIMFVDSPIFFLPVFLIIAWIYYSIKKEKKRKEKLLLIFYSCLLWILISITIQQFIHIDRPENYLKNTWKLLLQHLPDASFPSDHATVSFAFLTSLFLYNYKIIASIFLPFAILMWLSRISAWIHWPFDILFWMIIWIISALIVKKYVKNLKVVKKLNDFVLKLTSKIKL